MRRLTSIAVASLVFFAGPVGCSKSARSEKALARAQAHQTAGNFDAAEVEYRKALQLNPNSAAAIRQLAYLFDDQGRTGAAVATLRKARTDEPENLETRIRLAKLLLLGGRPAEALEEATFVLTRKADHPEAAVVVAQSTPAADLAALRATLAALPNADSIAPIQVGLSIIDLRERKVADAEKRLLRAKELDPKSAEVWSALCVVYLGTQRLDEARAAIKEATAQLPLRTTRRILQARLEAQAGNVEGARAILDELNKKAPDFLPGWVGRAELAFGERKFDECKNALDKVLARDGRNVEVLVLQARVALTQNKPAEAIKFLDRAITEYPALAELHHQLGLAQLAAGDVNKATASFNKALSLNPQLADASLQLANLKSRQGDPAEAQRLAEEVLKFQPRNPQARLVVADALRLRGQTAEALKAYQELQAANPGMRDLPVMIGMLQAQSGRAADARATYEKGLAANPTDAALLEALVNLDLAEKKPAAARQRVEQVIARGADRPEYRLLAARIALVQEDVAEAEKQLRQALQLQPDFRPAYQILAQIALASKDHAKALTELQASIARQPKDTAALFQIGMISEVLGRFDEARDAYEKALAIDGNLVIALNNLAWLQIDRYGQVDKGVELARKARELAPGDANIADTLGWGLYKQGQHAWALAMFRESADKMPDNAEVAYHVGLAEYMLGNEAGATDQFRRATALGLAGRSADDARERMKVLEAQSGGESEAWLKRFVEQNPKDPIALVRLAGFGIARGDDAGAESLLRRAIEATPANVGALLALARLQARKPDGLAAALESARAAHKVNGSNPDTLQLLGHLALRSGDARWAVSLLSQLTGPAAANPAVRFDLGKALFATGQLDDAGATFAAALRDTTPFAGRADLEVYAALVDASRDPSTAAAALSRAEAALQQDPANLAGQYVRALATEIRDADAALTAYEKIAETAAQFAPARRQIVLLGARSAKTNDRWLQHATAAREAYSRDAALARAYGILLARNGDHARAVTLLQEGLAEKPDDALALLQLGLSQLKQKAVADGKASLQKALAAGLSAAQAEEARKALAEAK